MVEDAKSLENRQAFEEAHESAAREVVDKAATEFISTIEEITSFENRQAFEDAHEAAYKESLEINEPYLNENLGLEVNKDEDDTLAYA